jgi:ribonuclease BN (tRNA processing enzyme)
LKEMVPKKNNFRIVNGWSKAGVGTSIVLTYSALGGKKRNTPFIAFDLGATPAYLDAIRASCVLLTHGHMDHIGAIFSHARAHKLTFGGGSSSVPTYYVPLEILPLVQTAKEAMTAIDAAGRDGHSLLEMNLVGVTPGQEVVLPFPKLNEVEIFVRPFRTTHAGCPSVGYILGTRQRRKELKAEYRGLSGREMGELARSGVSLKDEIVTEELDVAYTGDTTIHALLTTLDDATNAQSFSSEAQIGRQDSRWFHCDTVFCECTFLDPDSKDMAQDRGHMHVADVVRLLEESCDDASSAVQRLVLLHLSGRYGASQALVYLEAAIPQRFHNRIDVAVMPLSGSDKYQDLATNSFSGEWTVPLAAYAMQRKAEGKQSKGA